jgi:ElaB/YqjD/DUF883 family membrane-anchored ribosome-binding protein
MAEVNKMDELLEESKKHIGDLKASLDKLTDTAQGMAGVKAEELSHKATEMMAEAKTHADAAKATIEKKIEDIRTSDEFKNLETEGKQKLEEAEALLKELSDKAHDITAEWGKKLSDLFGSSDKPA